MRKDVQERIAEDLLNIPPIIFRAVRRKLIKTTIADCDVNLTPHHFGIINLLEEEGTLHVAEIGQRLQIAKAQMTKLIDKLVAMEMVERTIDVKDRRTHNITLTAKARTLLEENKNFAKEALKEMMSGLTDQEMENLSVSLRNLRDILSKGTGDSNRDN